jgi:hypothetical protein
MAPRNRSFWGDDAYFNTRVDLDPGVLKARLVFAGYGLKIPEKNYSDPRHWT